MDCQLLCYSSLICLYDALISRSMRENLVEPSDETNKRKFFRTKSSKERILNFRITISNLVLCTVILGAFLTLISCYLSIYDAAMNAEEMNTASRMGENLTPKWIRDDRYISHSAINWDEVSRVVEKLTDRHDYPGIGLLNFHDRTENDKWKILFPQAENVVLNLEHLPRYVTWETIYPLWIDEEENLEVPTCYSLPKIHLFSGKPRIDFVAVKLPCNKTGDRIRDVARLHLQIAAAGLAATSKGLLAKHILLISDNECFPTPNLFTCKELVGREGNVWLYEPDLNTLREKLHLPVGSCELSVPLKTNEEHWHFENARQEAYVTILHSSNDYVCGAIVVAQSIRMAGSTRDLIILVDETINEHNRRGLQAAGWKIRTIQRIKNPKGKRGSYNEWNYSKFRIWQLTEYSKIIFIDADLLILRNIDFLFKMPEISASWDSGALFNSGLMVVEPSNCTFQLLMDHVNEIESYNGGDQGYLNEIFTWWHRIPKRMNYIKYFWSGEKESAKKIKTQLFGANPPVLHVIHYVGMKPWLCFRDYDCNWNLNTSRKYSNDAAHKTWWKIHDAMAKNLQKYCLLHSEQKEALELARKQAEKANYSDGHWKIKIQDHL